MANKSENDDQSNALFRWALVATTIYAGILIVLLVAILPSGGWKNLTHNSIGDFLAGVFSPVAFFWFIVTVLLQRSELQETRRELQRTADAQTQQAELFKASLALSERNTRRMTFMDGAANCKALIETVLSNATLLRLTHFNDGEEISELPENMQRPFKDRENSIIPKEGDGSLTPEEFYDRVIMWNWELQITDKPMWQSIVASNHSLFCNSFQRAMYRLRDWFNNMKAQADVSDYPQFERECMDLGIYVLLSAMEEMGMPEQMELVPLKPPAPDGGV